jgi:hypothetical protein
LNISQLYQSQNGIGMGVNNLVDIFDEKYYRHLSGGILEAFGKLFYPRFESILISDVG